MNAEPTAATGRWPSADFDLERMGLGPRTIHAHLTRPIVQQLVGAGARTVLELGCGNGWFSGALDRCGFTVTGADRRDDFLGPARTQFPGVRFSRMDVTEPLDPEFAARFDAVVAIDLIDHLPLPRALVRTALAALKPGGLLVVTAAYYGYLKNLALALTGRFDARWDPLLDEGRVKFFSRSTLVSMLSEFELRDLHVETVGRIPAFARAMLVAGRARG